MKVVNCKLQVLLYGLLQSFNFLKDVDTPDLLKLRRNLSLIKMGLLVHVCVF